MSLTEPKSICTDATGSPVLLLAGPDTIHTSCDVTINDEVREKLDKEKEAAQIAAKVGAVHCPDWLGAQMLPHGSRGGYGHLIETDDFSVKVLGKNIPNRPGLYLELRSHFLHTHPEGPQGACEEALCWVREQLLYDLDATLVEELASFDAARLSRVDIHADWQRGIEPSPALVAPDAGCAFIKPARVKWTAYTDGTTFTGFVFGSGPVLARIYNKSHRARERADDGYFALLTERNGARFNPEQEVWRLEYQLRREGVKGFRLYAEPEPGDDDAAIDAELSAEDLQHVGTLPRFFAHQARVWDHLTTHWLRLAVDDGQANRSRWPLDPTWALLRSDYARLADALPLGEDAREVVRGARYDGKRRILRRLLLGVTASLEVEDASPTSAALAALKQWVDTAAEREEERAAARRARYEQKYGYVPSWVEKGMGARLERAQAVKHRVQMLLGIFGARGVLALEQKPAYDVGSLLSQHLDDLEAEAELKGGVSQVLADHFAKVYKVAVPRDFFAPLDEAA